MITKQTTIYKCEHCRKRLLTKRAMAMHERHCPCNPERIPKTGELYSEEIRFFPWTEDEFCRNEPDDRGVIWDGEQWQPVPEYRYHHYHDGWPEVSIYGDEEGGTPLNRVRLDERILALVEDYGPDWAADERARRIEAAKPKMLPPPAGTDLTDPFEETNRD